MSKTSSLNNNTKLSRGCITQFFFKQRIPIAPPIFDSSPLQNEKQSVEDKQPVLLCTALTSTKLAQSAIPAAQSGSGTEGVNADLTSTTTTNKRTSSQEYQSDDDSDGSSTSDRAPRKKAKLAGIRWTKPRLRFRIAQLEEYMLQVKCAVPAEDYEPPNEIARVTATELNRRGAYAGREWEPEKREIYCSTVEALFVHYVFKEMNPFITAGERKSVLDWLRNPQCNIDETIKKKPWLVCCNFKTSNNKKVAEIILTTRGKNNSLTPRITVKQDSVPLARALYALFRPELRDSVKELDWDNLTCSHLAGSSHRDCCIGRTNVNPWMITFESINTNKSRDVCRDIFIDSLTQNADSENAFEFASAKAMSWCQKMHSPRCQFIDFRHADYEYAKDVYQKEVNAFILRKQVGQVG